mgnify:CR=1 FL=1
MPPERKECKRDYDWHHHYWQGKLGLCVSMFDEVAQVSETIDRLKPRISRMLVARSGEAIPEEWLPRLDWHGSFEDLSGSVSKWEVPAASLCRNFSALAESAIGFSEVEWWVFVTGDTVLLHEYGLERAIADAAEKECVLAACCAYGQEFHAADLTLADLEAGKGGGRKQLAGTSDFMPQLFMVASEALPAFRAIPITNKWTSEACLGDAFVSWAGEGWRARRHLYAVKAASYSDGVVHHAKYG